MDLRKDINNLTKKGWILTGSFIVISVLWSQMASLSGAVLSQGVVVVDTSSKKIQHPTGGIIGKILVKNGDLVRTGDIVLQLDETITRSNFQTVVKQLDELQIRQARLVAERDQSNSIVIPAALFERSTQKTKDAIDVQKIIDGELYFFESRKSSRIGQKSQLRERIQQSTQEITGQTAQRKAKEEEIRLIKRELEGVQKLYNQGLVPLTRLTQLQREATRIEGERAQLEAAIAQVKGKISETELQILQIDQDLINEVNKDLRESSIKEGEYTEKKVTSEDQLRRVDLRAPQNGRVHDLSVHTIGGVISAGEQVMLIVPDQDALVIESKIQPQDIDNIFEGQNVFIRFTAFNQRTTPEFNGKIWRVSADLSKEVISTNGQPQPSYFTARILINENELKETKNLKLVPGMPAEIHIKTQERTVLSYFIKPLTDQMARAFKDK